MTRVPCKHWRPAGAANGGRCELRIYGETVSLGVCRICPHATHLRGLGDLVHRITTWVGLVRVMERRSCKCANRRQSWNRIRLRGILAHLLPRPRRMNTPDQLTDQPPAPVVDQAALDAAIEELADEAGFACKGCAQ